MTGNGRLTTKQSRAIACLLSERTVAAAATKAGVGQATLYTWLAQEDFRAALTRAEGQAIDESVRALVRVAGGAVETLERTMLDPTATASARVRAAQSILESLLKLRELRTLEERVSRLEAARDERFTQ